MKVRIRMGLSRRSDYKWIK